jgi:RimJ/RimL family protein N-acetyltransferase
MNVTLREYTMDDADRLTELANNKNVSRWLDVRFPYPYTRADAEWWITTGNGLNGEVSRVIDCDGELVGGIGLAPQYSWRKHCAEIGYWLGEPYWGRGIGTEALRQMTDHAFRELGFRKLYAPVLAPNKASMRILEKCGYTQEAHLPQDVFKGDTYYDIIQFSLLAQ